MLKISLNPKLVLVNLGDHFIEKYSLKTILN